MPALSGINKPGGGIMGIIRAVSGGSSFIQKLSTVQAPSGFVHDHGVNSYADAPITGDYRLAIPGLLPIFGKDDGALRGDGTVTYPVGSAISGTGDFTIVAFAVISGVESISVYQDTDLQLSLQGGQDRLVVTVNSFAVIDEQGVGITDGRTHLFVLRRTSGLLEIFVDGRLIDSVTATDNLVSAAPKTDTTAGAPTVDEVAWWRRALTAIELEMLIAASGVLSSSTGLLTGEWLDLHLADFCFSDADLDTGSSMIDTPDLSTGDAALVLAEIAQAEDGMIFVNGAGELRFIGRNSFGLPVCTIGDTVDDDIPITGAPEWSMDIDQVFNRIQVQKDGYPLVQQDDLASQNDYGIRALPWSANLLEASQMEDAAAWLLPRYKNPRLRVDTVQVRGGDWPTLLSLELGDRVTINHHPPGGTLLTAGAIIEHIEYQLAPDDWLITLQLAPTPPVMIWDDPVQGFWDDWVWGWGEPAAA